MKKAFVVLGPESSGTKLVTKIFIESGCFGDDGHNQKLDQNTELNDIDTLVFRRSVPHSRVFPDIKGIQDRFEKQGFEVFWVIVVRDWTCTAESAPKYGHKGCVQSARKCLPGEWRYIGDNLKHMKKFYFILTSALFLEPLRSLKSLENWIGMSINYGIVKEIFDADEKYF